MEIPPSNSKLHKNTSKIQSYISQSVKRNSFLFAILMIILQIAIIIIYAILIQTPQVTINTGSVVISICLAFLVVAGFGLLFGYTRRLAWSGIGFNLFIMAFCIEVYPLINDFWTKTRIQSNNSPSTDFTLQNKSYSIYLTDRETSPAGLTTFYGNSITNAIKCALSISVAFSSILGRAGPLQCLIVTSFGIIGYELNRQIIQQNQGTDIFGSFYIFTFGGLMGLGLGLMEFIRQRKSFNKLVETSLKKYTCSGYSALYASFGCLIIFLFFPLLAYEVDAYARYNLFTLYTNPVCVIIAMGAGAIGALLVSLSFNGILILRDVLHGPIAGAIAVGSSSLYITNPVYALVAGASAGIIQSLIQNYFEKTAIKKRNIISTVSWSLFGFEGLVGAGFASGWKAIYITNTSGMTIESSTLNFSSQFQFYGGLISAGIGLGFGLLAGLIVIFINNQTSKQYFDDYFYWFGNDGVKYLTAGKNKPVLPPNKQKNQNMDEKVEIVQKKQDEGKESRPNERVVQIESEQVSIPENLSSEHDQFDFSEGEQYNFDRYAYL